MRIIDADKVIEEMRKWYFDEEKQEAAKKDVSPMDLFIHLAIATVKEQPIAFDVENIIKQLEKERDSSYEDYENYAEKHDMDVECDDLFCRGLDRAIEIVKRGGRI